MRFSFVFQINFYLKIKICLISLFTVKDNGNCFYKINFWRKIIKKSRPWFGDFSSNYSLLKKYKTVNGVPGNGESIDSASPVITLIADGMI